MIGIRNADSTISWVLESQPGESVDARLRLVRHGQKKANICFLKRDDQGNEREIGLISLQIKADEFLDESHIDAHLHLDNRGKLSVLLDFNGQTTIRKFTALEKNSQSKTRTEEISNYSKSKEKGPHPALSFTLFFLGTAMLSLAILLLAGAVKLV